MPKPRATQLTLAVMLSASATALAHGPGSQDNTLHHYLSSPDHVLILALAGLAAVVALNAARRVLRRPAAGASRQNTRQC